MIRSFAVAAVFALPLLGGAALAALGSPTPTALASPLVPGAEPPSIVQLCAATDDEQLDALLAGVAETDLVEGLAPLVGLTVPQGAGRVLRADVDLAEVREALDCTPVDPTPEPTTQPITTTPRPTDPEPTTEPTTPRQDDGDGDGVDEGADDGSTPDTSGDQVTIVPEGSVDTGGA